MEKSSVNSNPTLRYYEEFEDKSEALRRECALKKMSHAKKQALIEKGKK